MMMPDPASWFSRRTCHHLALAAAVRGVGSLPAHRRGTAQEDPDLLRLAHVRLRMRPPARSPGGPREGSPRAGEAAAQIARMGIATWQAPGRGGHADHLRTLAHPLIGTPTDEGQRKRPSAPWMARPVILLTVTDVTVPAPPTT